MKSSLWLIAAVGIVLPGISGCATQDYVRQQIAQAMDARVGVVERQTQANQAEIASLKDSNAQQKEQLSKLTDTVRDALTRAEKAGKLAEGKFLYEVTLSDDAVHFGFNKADLSKEAKAALDAFAARLKAENKNVYIEIQGHTDSVGPEKYNLKLGQARAKAVRGYLYTQNNLPLHRMSTFSYGESKPVADNKSAEGRAKNRRVTLVVLQ
jgi:peptidoglycan-associated lipoprotein